MSNFKTTLYYSLKPKIFSKSFISFVVAVFGIMIMLGVGGALVYNYFDAKNDEAEVFAIKTKNEELISFVEQYEQSNDGHFAFEITESDQTNEEMKYIYDADQDLIYHYDDIGTTDQIRIESIIYNLKIMNINLTEEQKIQVNNLENFNFVYQGEDSEINNSGVFQTITVLLTMGVYILIMFAVQFLGQEILDEKSSKAMEIIISNVDPKQHMLAKIISNIIFITISGIIFLVAAIIALIAGLSIIELDVSAILDIIKSQLEINDVSQLINLIIIYIILITLGLFILLGIMAILSSIASNQEDYQKVTMPVALFMVVPYFAALIPAIEGTIIKVLGLIPVYNIFFVPELYLLNDLTIGYFILCISISVIVLFIVFKYGSEIYKEGVLNYSSADLKTIVKNARMNYKYQKQNKQN